LCLFPKPSGSPDIMDDHRDITGHQGTIICDSLKGM
jgi:hypothetical protein